MRFLAWALTLLLATAHPAVASAGDPETPFGGGHDLSDDVHADGSVADDAITIDVAVTAPGTPGGDGSVETAGGDAEAAPEGVSISVPDMVFVTDPPCIRTTSQFIEGVTPEEAEVIRWTIVNQFVAEYEAYISRHEPPPPCDGGDGSPGFGPTPSQQFRDSAKQILPTITPTISGDYAITGLRSWLDLGRPASLTTTHEFTLGGTTVTATITATTTASIDWGDGTVTTHASQGGAYHEGEPGPDDITHTYRDAVDSNTLTATDSWDVLISFPDSPVPDISLNWGAEPETMTFPIREVRSSRDR